MSKRSDQFHLGVQLSSRTSNWTPLREAAALVDELGYDSLWVPDHLIGFHEMVPVLECWELLAAIGAVTRRVRLGPLVSPVGFRNPGLLAKLVATLDRITNGRAILGIGAGGHEPEHRAFALAFGSGRDRVERVAETIAICRSLLAEPRTTFEGRHYSTRDATSEPKPVQERIPIMMAGAGSSLLRVVARHADMWNMIALPEVFADRASALRRALAEIGRDPKSLLLTATFRVIIRDSETAIAERIEQIISAGGERDDPYRIAGDEEAMAAQLDAYRRAGADGVIVQIGPPYDLETISRLASVGRAR